MGLCCGITRGCWHQAEGLYLTATRFPPWELHEGYSRSAWSWKMHITKNPDMDFKKFGTRISVMFHSIFHDHGSDHTVLGRPRACQAALASLQGGKYSSAESWASFPAPGGSERRLECLVCVPGSSPASQVPPASPLKLPRALLFRGWAGHWLSIAWRELQRKTLSC